VAPVAVLRAPAEATGEERVAGGEWIAARGTIDVSGQAGEGPASGPIWRKALHLIAGALPAVTVATAVPVSLFYAFSAAAGMKAGIIASLAWAYLMLGRQIIRSRRFSGVLLITAFTLTIRCVTWAVHQSAFTYFAVPVAETIGMSLLFVVTLMLGKPLLVCLARDFVPSVGDRLAHSDHKRLVRDLSCVWGAVYLGSATSSAVLLSTQNMHLFLLLHQASGSVWTGSGLIVTFAYARRHAQELMALATAGVRTATV
jgi:hypothetical protein